MAKSKQKLRNLKATTSQTDGLRLPAFRKMLPLGIVALLTLGTCFWFATYGTGELFVEHEFGTFHDALASSFQQGRLDVPVEDVSGEAMVVNGKYYGYHGPVPALPRILVNAIYPDLSRKWSRLSLILSCVCHFVFLVLILQAVGCRLDHPFPLVFLTGAMVGSTTVFMAAWPTTYHEVTSWGAAFGLAAAYFLLRYLEEPKTSLITAVCILTAACLFSRPPVALAPMAALGAIVLFCPAPAPARHRLLIIAAMGLTLGLFCWFNYARFGTWIDAMPVRFGVQYGPDRIARIDGTMIHPELSPYLLVHYLTHPFYWRDSYPWIVFAPYPWISQVRLPVDLVEKHVGILYAVPGLLLLSITGLWRGWIGFTRSRLIQAAALCYLVPFAFLLCFAFAAHRYLHDLFPFFGFAGALGVRHLTRLSDTIRRKAVYAAAVLLLLAVPVNLAISLVWQREASGFGAPDEAKLSHLATRARVDAWLYGYPSPQLDYELFMDPLPEIPGLLLRFSDAQYRFDGEAFRYVSGKRKYRYAVKFRLDPAWKQQALPLLGFGANAEVDVVMIMRKDPDSFSLCYHSSGNGGGCSHEIPLESNTEYVVVADLEKMNQTVKLTLNGRQVFAGKLAMHNWPADDFQVGKSRMPQYYGDPFPGKIELLAGN